MDDLDHSIHIAETDWTSFCEESEECSLLKPSIARPDSSGLSDTEESETSSPEQSIKSRTGEEQDEKRLCNVCSAGNTLVTTEVHAMSTEETKAANITGLTDKLQTEGDNSRNDPGPPFFDQADLNGTEPQATGAALSRVGGSAEERWFVTVNDRPARQQAAASSVKRKTRPKQPCKDSWSSKQETSVDNALDMIKDTNDYEGKRDRRGFVQLKQILVQKAGETSSDKINHDLPQMWHKNETVSEMLLPTNLLMEHVAVPTMGRNTHEPGSRSRDVFSLEATSHVESAETDKLDFCSIHSRDYESYLSAAESTEEPLYQLKDHVTEKQLLLSTTSRLLNTSQAQHGGLSHCDNALSCNVSPTECDGSEWFCVEPTLAFPSADKMPDDNSTCVKDTHSTELCVPSHTHTLQKQETRPSASGSSSGHQLSPDLPAAPCSVTSGAGPHAEAAGLTGPVFAISAFWNEMEELTINDILRLRMGRSAQTRETHSFRADSAERDQSDAGLMDTSDVADSGYVTQPDESKPDCSSCEFSTSDFEEEYWQFSGASRNPSPDVQGKNHPKMTGSAFLCHEELLCTCSEGKEPHEPSEDCAGQSLDHHKSHKLMKPSNLGEITKTQTFNTEELTSGSLLGNDENTLFLSHSKALEENLALKQNNCLETLTPAPILSSTDMLDKRYQISIPEVFEYFFTEDVAKNDPCAAAYNPEDMSLTPVCDCTKETTFSHSTVGDLTFPKPNHLFLTGHCEDGDVSPALPQSYSQAGDCEAGKSRTWKTLLSIRKICFHTKGSRWCRRSGAWVFPVDAEQRKHRPIAVITEGRVHWRIWETLHTPGQEGVFSTLKQSDMCLVCIAFASWVLRSYNPEAADAWKAALLANVSALSAIQFLRHYVKKTPLQDDP